LTVPPPELSRVVVIGTSGSGKSTVGARLAAVLGARFIELDELFWGPDWQPKPQETFVALVRDAAAGDRWVVAGNYGVARPELWPRASAIVWLNFGLGVVLRRVVLRTARRLWRREVLWHGNRESLPRTLFTRIDCLVGADDPQFARAAVHAAASLRGVSAPALVRVHPAFGARALGVDVARR